MKKLSLVLLLFFNFAFSQNYELGKVTVDELKEKTHPIDTSAVAAILFNKCDVYVDNSMGIGVTYTFEMKIKIYKNKGFKYANFEKTYFGEKYSNNLSITDVATYNLVDGNVEKTKVKNEGIFVTQENVSFQSKKISFPNVKEGTIIEYKYVLKSGQFFQLQDFYFQYPIPVNFVQYAVRVPAVFLYNKALYGFIPLNQTDVNVGNSNKTIYSFRNVPAIKGESYVNNINNYRSRMTYDIASYVNYYGVIENYASNWETLVKNIYRVDNFGDQLKIDNYFKDDIKPLLAGLTSRDEKIKVLFNYVQYRMKWNENYGYTCDLGVKKAYKDKTGNTADINLMLVAMLRYADLKANPILISTRRNGVSIFPSISAFNHVIAGVEIENDIILLDATDKNAYIDIIPTEDLNWTGRIVRSEELSFDVDVMPKVISKNIVNCIATINNDGSIEGKIREQYFDYNAYVFRDEAADLTKEKQAEEAEKKHKGLEIEDYDFTNKTELDKPAIENYSFRHTTCVEIIGDKMYFSPMLFFALTENPFKLDVREYPIDFTFPNQDKHLITLTIPDGYVVETLPQSVSIPMSDNKGSLKYMITNKDKQIQLSVTMEINSAIISSEYYEELKGFFAEAIKKQTEKIVLKKI